MSAELVESDQTAKFHFRTVCLVLCAPAVCTECAFGTDFAQILLAAQHANGAGANNGAACCSLIMSLANTWHSGPLGRLAGLQVAGFKRPARITFAISRWPATNCAALITRRKSPPTTSRPISRLVVGCSELFEAVRSFLEAFWKLLRRYRHGQG